MDTYAAHNNNSDVGLCKSISDNDVSKSLCLSKVIFKTKNKLPVFPLIRLTLSILADSVFFSQFFVKENDFVTTNHASMNLIMFKRQKMH